MRARLTFVALAASALALLTAPALAADDDLVLATEEEGEEVEGTETTVTENDSGIVPAVEAEVVEEEEVEAPWTQRFLAPTLLLLGAIGIVGVIVYYFFRIRGRYQVVD